MKKVWNRIRVAANRAWMNTRCHAYGIKNMGTRIGERIQYRRNRKFYARALQHALPFRTTNGVNIHIIPEAAQVIRAPSEKENHRPFIVTLVDGKRLYFYKSTGLNSGRPGQWLPTAGVMAVGEVKGGKMVRPERLRNYLKMREHWDHYPAEIDEIGRRIGELERMGHIPLRWVSLKEQLAIQKKWDLWPHRERVNRDGDSTLFPSSAGGH